MTEVEALGPGEVGYITAQIKQVADTRVGDTITDDKRPTAAALPGFKPAQPVVFAACSRSMRRSSRICAPPWAGFASTTRASPTRWRPSAALGFGFRCGFLGLLHLEIIQERLEREFNLDLIATAPAVVYRILLTSGEIKELHNPADMPDVMKIETIEEPWIRATILTPDEYLGGILKLCQDRRGVQIDLNYVGKRAMVVYDLPLNEVGVRLLRPAEIDLEGLRQFRLSAHRLSRGRPRQNVDPRQRRAGRRVRRCSCIAPAPTCAAAPWCEKLKDLIPPHMFQIPIQAAIGGKIIARETVRACARTSPPNAMAATSPASASSSRSRRKARSACAIRQGRNPAGGFHRGIENGCVIFGG
jgi:GTP-binding protein LepA